MCFTFFSTESNDFCNVENLLLNTKIKNCKKNQILFGNIDFNSKISKLEFEYNDEFNVKIPENFDKEIVLFIRNNCQKDKLKIKTITNVLPNTNIKNYSNRIIISCIFK